MATKILIVEDDQLMQRMYQKIFMYEKFEVEVVSDGEEGLQKARQTKPNIILLDIMVPKMNGIQVLEKLKLDLETSNIPVVLLSNLADDGAVEMALSRGAAKYLIKSQYDPKDVVDIIKQIIVDNTRDTIPAVD